MERESYLELYISESDEYLRTLNDAILELESSDGKRGLERAFRAAHTLKGMSAAMGFEDAADRSHRLEDLLDALRRGRRKLTARLVDELLRLSDDVEVAVRRGPAAGPRPATEPSGEPPAPTAAGADLESGGAVSIDAAEPTWPEGTALIARVVFDRQAALPGVRAFMALRALRESAPVLGSDPPEPETAFAGTLAVYFGPDADAGAIESIVRGIGDVADISLTRPATGMSATPVEANVLEASPSRRDRRRFLRVDLHRLDDLADGMAELGVLQSRLREIAVVQGEESLLDAVDRAGRRIAELQDTVLSVRMVPLREAFDRFPRIVRDTARAVGKRIELEVHGSAVEVDRAIVDAIADPLIHLLRNAVDHGIEPNAEREAAGKPSAGRLTLRAEREQSRVVIVVGDDGRGIDRQTVLGRAQALGLADADAEDIRDSELLRILGQSGFSTAHAVTELSGRGVGLDVVLDRVRALGGSIEMRTEPGVGTSFTIRLPITLAVTQALRVRVGSEDYMIPLTHVVEAVELEAVDVTRIRGEEALDLRGELVPVTRLNRLLGNAADGELAAVIAESGERRGALAVDALVGREQIVLKNFDSAAGTLPIFTGVTLLADGRPALVLDPLSVF